MPCCGRSEACRKCLSKKKRSPFGNIPSSMAHVLLLTECLFSPVNQEALLILDCTWCGFLLAFLFLNHFGVLLSSHEFECEQVPELTVRDTHSVSSLCKMYFRELPNPLLTHQLYDKFSVSTRQRLSFSSSLGLLGHGCSSAQL